MVLSFHLLVFQAMSLASAQSPVQNVPFRIRYSDVTKDGPTAWLPLSDEPVLDDAIMLNFEYQTELANSPAQGSVSPGELFTLWKWLSAPDVLSLVTPSDRTGISLYPPEELNITDSGYDQCRALYSCIFSALRGFTATTRSMDLDHHLYGFFGCTRSAQVETVSCVMNLWNSTFGYFDQQYLGRDTCSSGWFGLTANDWMAADTDVNIQRFIESRADTFGLYWQGMAFVDREETLTNGSVAPETPPTFSVALGRQMLGDQAFKCSLAAPCAPQIDCRSVGNQIAYEFGQEVFPVAWAFYVMTAIKNINQQLSNQYVAIKGAAITATLRTWSIKDFFPDPKKPFPLLDALQAIASAFSLFGGLVPGISGKAFAQGGNFVGAVNGFLGRHIPPEGPEIPQEKYADSIEAIYSTFVDNLDDVTQMLFDGGSINGEFNITDMMKGGAWVDVSQLEPVSNMEQYMRIEIISRSINALWKTPTSNKMFVVAVRTPDCASDTSGPADLKWCGEDGYVYHAYNFIEGGEGVGYLGWPWGADQMKQKLGIDPAVGIDLQVEFGNSVYESADSQKWITEASARTYQVAKPDPALDPFNFSYVDGTAAFLDKYLNSGTPLNLSNLAGRLPGLS